MSDDAVVTYGVVDPDYAKIYSMARCIAHGYGFACVMHGSFTKDLDLLLVPWTPQADTGRLHQLVKMIAEAGGLRELGEPSIRSHGRKSYTLVFPGFGDPRYVDISGFDFGQMLTADEVETKVSNAVSAYRDEVLKVIGSRKSDDTDWDTSAWNQAIENAEFAVRAVAYPKAK